MSFQDKTVFSKFIHSLRTIVTYKKNLDTFTKLIRNTFPAIHENFSERGASIIMKAFLLDIIDTIRLRMNTQKFNANSTRAIRVPFEYSINYYINQFRDIISNQNYIADTEYDIKIIMVKYIHKVGSRILEQDLRKITTIQALKSRIGDATKDVTSKAFSSMTVSL